MFALFVVSWLICGVIGGVLTFRGFRSMKLEAPLFTAEEIAAWDTKWLPRDIVGAFLGFLLGPIGIVIGIVLPKG